MSRYLVSRLLLSLPVLLMVSLLVFGAIRVLPGDVCRTVLQSPEVTDAQCSRVKHDLGLDKPFVTQYFIWAGNVLEGDLGTSMSTRHPVVDTIVERMYATIELALLSIVFAVAVGLPLGSYCAFRQDRLPDVVIRLLTISWLSMPSFWLGALLITYPSKWWGYSAPVGYVQVWDDPLKNLEQLLLPVIALGLGLAATLTRFVRSSMLEVLRQDYIRTARAKGLRERVVVLSHALRNAMLPVITLIGLQVGFLLGGTITIESLFALPGLGTLLLSSVLTKDFVQIQGLVLVFAIMIVTINLVVDLSYSWFDPRIRHE